MKIIFNSEISITCTEFIIDISGQYYNISEMNACFEIRKEVDKDSTIPDITIQPINVNTISID
jgi:hypothetical protein